MGIRKIYVFIASLVIILFMSANVFADFYNYTDEDGVVHITNVPTSSKYRWMMGEKKVPKPNVEKANNKRFEDIIYSASARYGIDPTLVKAIVKAESDFDSMAISNKGARGLMQLMPETARTMGVRDIHDPEENIEGGIRKLSLLLNMFDRDVNLAVAAYNAGEQAVLKYRDVPPYTETRNYVKKVLHYYNLYKGVEK